MPARKCRRAEDFGRFVYDTHGHPPETIALRNTSPVRFVTKPTGPGFATKWQGGGRRGCPDRFRWPRGCARGSGNELSELPAIIDLAATKFVSLSSFPTIRTRPHRSAMAAPTRPNGHFVAKPLFWPSLMTEDCRSPGFLQFLTSWRGPMAATVQRIRPPL